MTAGLCLIFIYTGIIVHSVITAIEARKGGDFRGGFQRLNVTIAAFAFLVVYRSVAVEFFNVTLESNPILRLGSGAFLLTIVIINHVLVFKARKQFKSENEPTGTDTTSIQQIPPSTSIRE